MFSRNQATIIGLVGLVLMGIPAWDILETRGAVSGAVSVGTLAISVILIAYSTYNNLIQSRRAESRQAKLDNESAQWIADLQSERTKLLANGKSLTDGLSQQTKRSDDNFAKYNDEVEK